MVSSYKGVASNVQVCYNEPQALLGSQRAETGDKIVKGIAQVLICDGVPDSKGNTIRIAGLTLPTEDVPVVLEFQERYLPAYVGRAKLQMNAGVVYADLILLPRLGENSALFTLYPILVFKDIDQRDKVMYSGRAEYVGLSITCNPDQRIRTLGEQGVRP